MIPCGSENVQVLIDRVIATKDRDTYDRLAPYFQRRLAMQTHALGVRAESAKEDFEDIKSLVLVELWVWLVKQVPGRDIDGQEVVNAMTCRIARRRLIDQARKLKGRGQKKNPKLTSYIPSEHDDYAVAQFPMKLILECLEHGVSLRE